MTDPASPLLASPVLASPLLERIAAALERLAPPPMASADPLAHPAYLWRGGALHAARGFAPVPLDLLQGLGQQRAALLANLVRLADGHAAQDVLLWGARGTGKSALVKAGVASVQADRPGRLALVSVDTLDSLPELFAMLEGVQRAFAVFIDDLGFDEAGEGRKLRSLLDGGAEARPAHVRLLVTANRRHLLPRDIGEQDSAINPRDVIDDQLALADRFGLSLGFHALDQDGYLAIVRAYAERYDLPFDGQEAVNWATRRGSRSGRVAWQYIIDLAGRSGRSLS